MDMFNKAGIQTNNQMRIFKTALSVAGGFNRGEKDYTPADPASVGAKVGKARLSDISAQNKYLKKAAAGAGDKNAALTFFIAAGRRPDFALQNHGVNKIVAKSVRKVSKRRNRL